jgi:predicted RNase H-like nuclease
VSNAGPVVGVDGCRQGWVAVTLADDGSLSAQLVTALDGLVAELRSGVVAALAVDMPIGLLNQARRACDVEARRLLGPRRSSVFPAPSRVTLDAADYDDACRRSRAAVGVALSRQAFNLLPKIRQLDRLVDPADQDRLVEAHPECAFARLAGRPLAEPKRTAEGQAVRRRLLIDHDEAFGPLLARSSGLPTLDLIDAAVLAITAKRVAAGDEHRLGHDVDPTGLSATIVY